MPWFELGPLARSPGNGEARRADALARAGGNGEAGRNAARPVFRIAEGEGPRASEGLTEKFGFNREGTATVGVTRLSEEEEGEGGEPWAGRVEGHMVIARWVEAELSGGSWAAEEFSPFRVWDQSQGRPSFLETAGNFRNRPRPLRM